MDNQDFEDLYFRLNQYRCLVDTTTFEKLEDTYINADVDVAYKLYQELTYNRTETYVGPTFTFYRVDNKVTALERVMTSLLQYLGLKCNTQSVTLKHLMTQLKGKANPSRPFLCVAVDDYEILDIRSLFLFLEKHGLWQL